MLCNLIVVSFFVAALSAPSNFYSNQYPLIINPGVNYTTSFSNYIGSQFGIYVPDNIARVKINWQINNVSYSEAVSINAKYGSWPCYDNSYPSLSNPLCLSNVVNKGVTTNGNAVSTLNAYNNNMKYWLTNNGDFLRGDWLYLYSSSSQSPSNTTATLRVVFEYCPSGTIAAENYTGSDTACVPFVNVTSTSYSENGTVFTPTFSQKFYVVEVPANSSGIQVDLFNTNYTSLTVLGRYSTGGVQNKYYYQQSYPYNSQDNGLYNQTVWFDNLPKGQFVISVIGSTSVASFYDLKITVKSCPPDTASDHKGNCYYPVTTFPLQTINTSSITTTVRAWNSSDSYCAWKFYGFLIPAWTYAFVNLTINETIPSGYSSVYVRKGAWPTEYHYDYVYPSGVTYNFTPEDTYLGKDTWWYMGFCNVDSSLTSTWTVTGNYLSNAPSPSPSSSPASVASPSRTPSPAAVSPSSPSPSPSPTSVSSPSRTPSPAAVSPSSSPSPAAVSPSSSPSTGVSASSSASPSSVVNPSASYTPDTVSDTSKMTASVMLISVLFVLFL